MVGMQRETIAIDADDTLFDENTAIRLYMNEHYGFSHTAADYLVPGPFNNYWENIWDLDPEQTSAMYEQFVESETKKNLEPIKDALVVLGGLKMHYDLVIVTSRDHRAVDFTLESLGTHYPDVFSDVHFVPLWGNGEKVTKARICNEIGATYLIDDSFEHCKLAADAGVNAIVFGEYGWNRTQPLAPGMTRCPDWQAVEAYFCE